MISDSVKQFFRQFFRQFFCRHAWKVMQTSLNENTRVMSIMYKCKKCGATYVKKLNYDILPEEEKVQLIDLNGLVYTTREIYKKYRLYV